MSLSHYEVVRRSEMQLIAALVARDTKIIFSLCHPNIIYTNEVGKTASGVEQLLVLRPEMLDYESIAIVSMDIHFFDSVAVVSSQENRSGTFLTLPFSSEYHLTRVWKFGTRWRLIAATSMMPC